MRGGEAGQWDLVATARERIGNFWSLTRSQVYRELAAMARDGLVTAGEKQSRDRQPYTLTAAGRAAFADWVRQRPAGETIRFPLLLTVAFGAHLDRADLDDLLATRREQHERQLAGYRDRRAEVAALDNPWALATLEFGIRHEEAILAWFADLPDVLPDVPPDPAGVTPDR